MLSLSSRKYYIRSSGIYMLREVFYARGLVIAPATHRSAVTCETYTFFYNIGKIFIKIVIYGERDKYIITYFME